MIRRPALFAAILFLATSPAFAANAKPVKVFILAGQSNMEGKVQNMLLEHQAKDPRTSKLFAKYRKDGQWVVRDDVFVKFLNHKGGLTIGYGSRNRTGVELAFGTMMGNHFDEPVLLIKTAWGGHSLYKPFRPPSAGMPSEAALQAELKSAQQRVTNRNKKRKRKAPLPTIKDITSGYGLSYHNMMKEVKDTFANYATMFPALKGRKLQLAGFVWFQGWNDMYGGAEKHYAKNMELFIKDVRKDLHAPKLPFVIGVMGQNGSKPPKGAMAVVQKAQLAMEQVPEFKGNVKAVRTDVLVDKAAEKLYPHWRQRFEEWKLVGSDRGYHYLGSAIWYNRIGEAMGKAMLGLVGK